MSWPAESTLAPGLARRITARTRASRKAARAVMARAGRSPPATITSARPATEPHAARPLRADRRVRRYAHHPGARAPSDAPAASSARAAPSVPRPRPRALPHPRPVRRNELMLFPRRLPEPTRLPWPARARSRRSSRSRTAGTTSVGHGPLFGHEPRALWGADHRRGAGGPAREVAFDGPPPRRGDGRREGWGAGTARGYPPARWPSL